MIFLTKIRQNQQQVYKAIKGNQIMYKRDKSELSTALELRVSECQKDDYILNVTNSLSSQIGFYKCALQNLEKTVKVYEEENYQYKLENEKLNNKYHRLQDNFKELMKRLIKDQKSKAKEIQMRDQIEQLSKKIQNYQKTIEILKNKLLILNVAIHKQEYAHKFPDIDLQTVSSNTQYKYGHKLQAVKQKTKYFNSTKPRLNRTELKQKLELTDSIYQTPFKSPLNSPKDNKMKKMQTLQTERNDSTDNEFTCRSSQFS